MKRKLIQKHSNEESSKTQLQQIHRLPAEKLHKKRGRSTGIQLESLQTNDRLIYRW